MIYIAQSLSRLLVQLNRVFKITYWSKWAVNSNGARRRENVMKKSKTMN